MGNFESFIIGLAVGGVAVLIASCIVFAVTIDNADKHIRQEAINAGYAQYDSVTGEWGWK